MWQVTERAVGVGQLERIDRPWRSMSGEVREAVLNLLAEPYVRLAYPCEADFAAAFGVAVGTPAYRAAWAGQLAERRALQQAAYVGDDWVYALCVRAPAGGLVALATLLTARGTRDVALADAIGDAASSFSTLRMLWFVCGPEAGLCAATTPERDLAEFARISIRQPEELLALVGAGVLTHAAADYVERHGFNEVFALSYWRDQARPAPPRAYIANALPRLSNALARRGLDVRPLYLAAGAEPTARVLNSGQSTSVYFGKWPALLRRYVPEAVLATGTAAAIAHLARQGFTDWSELELSLPFLILNNARTAGAFAQLAAACGLAADPVSLPGWDGGEG